jgi:hypothetical protein
MTEYKYSMRYTLKPEAKKDGFTKEDAMKGVGLCDAYLFVSILRPPDGSYSEYFFSNDGQKNGEELTDRDLFKHFCMLTMKLCKSENLIEWQKFVVTVTSELLTKIMTGIH